MCGSTSGVAWVDIDGPLADIGLCFPNHTNVVCNWFSNQDRKCIVPIRHNPRQGSHMARAFIVGQPFSSWFLHRLGRLIDGTVECRHTCRSKGEMQRCRRSQQGSTPEQLRRATCFYNRQLQACPDAVPASYRLNVSPPSLCCHGKVDYAITHGLGPDNGASLSSEQAETSLRGWCGPCDSTSRSLLIILSKVYLRKS